MPRHSTQTQEKERQQPPRGRQPGQAPRANPRSCEKDSVVGAEYLTRNDPDEVMIRFTEKPSQAVLGFLKDNEFRWSRKDHAWRRSIRFNTTGQDGDAGRRAYRKVVDILRIEKGIGPAQRRDDGLQ